MTLLLVPSILVPLRFRSHISLYLPSQLNGCNILYLSNNSSKIILKGIVLLSIYVVYFLSCPRWDSILTPRTSYARGSSCARIDATTQASTQASTQTSTQASTQAHEDDKNQPHKGIQASCILLSTHLPSLVAPRLFNHPSLIILCSDKQYYQWDTGFYVSNRYIFHYAPHAPASRSTTQHHAAPRSITQCYAALRSTTQHHAASRSITQHIFFAPLRLHLSFLSPCK